MARLLELGLITEHSPAPSGPNGGRPLSRYRLQQGVVELLGLPDGKLAAHGKKERTLFISNTPNTANTSETPTGQASGLIPGMTPEMAPNTANTPKTSAGGVYDHFLGGFCRF